MRIIRLSAAPDTAPDAAPDGPGGAPMLFGADGIGFYRDARRGLPLGVIADPAQTRPIADDRALTAYLAPRLDPAPARVVVLAHGFEFEPRRGLSQEAPPTASPNPHIALFHGREFADGPGRRREHASHGTPWLRRLALGPDDVALCFAYASDPGRVSVDFARPGMVSALRALHRRATRTAHFRGEAVNLFGHAYAEAPLWAGGLAAALSAVARLTGPETRIDILSHSLGARVGLSALTRMAAMDGPGPERIGKFLMLAAALLPTEAAESAARLAAAGARPEIYNFTSAYDRVLRNIGAPLGAEAPLRGRRPAGAPLRVLARGLIAPPEIVGVHGAPKGVGTVLPWLDIRLDKRALRRRARRRGLSLSGNLAFSPWDHWIHYTHPGNWALYNAILSGDPAWSMQAIRDGIVSDG